jgi:rhodanese-related sulfurtransferase
MNEPQAAMNIAAPRDQDLWARANQQLQELGMKTSPVLDPALLNVPDPFIVPSGQIQHGRTPARWAEPASAPAGGPAEDAQAKAAQTPTAPAAIPCGMPAGSPNLPTTPQGAANPQQFDFATISKMIQAGMAAALSAAAPASPAGSPGDDVYRAILHEPNPKTGQVSTEEMVQIVAQHTATIFDGRTQLEYAIGHSPEALSLAPKPGAPKSQYVGDVNEIARIVPDRNAPIIIYCNGPFCGKSRRLGEELANAGFTNVRRYQLGTPVWRALVGPMQIEADGIRYILKGDQTAVFLDARSPNDFAAGSLSGAKNVPANEIAAAKSDGRLPMNDFNTRIVTFGRDGDESLALAKALAHTGFNNVKFFNGTFASLLMAAH